MRVLIPPNGFASERQLAEYLSQAGAASDFASQDDPGSSWNDFVDDDFSMGEYFDDRRESLYVAVS